MTYSGIAPCSLFLVTGSRKATNKQKHLLKMNPTNSNSQLINNIIILLVQIFIFNLQIVDTMRLDKRVQNLCETAQLEKNMSHGNQKRAGLRR